jgi:hypothetical protein
MFQEMINIYRRRIISRFKEARSRQTEKAHDERIDSVDREELFDVRPQLR